MIDYLIRNGSVIDGGGAGPAMLNIGITDDLVSFIGTEEPAAGTVIDANGLFVAPGFIDTHAHSEFTLLADGRAEGKLSQGVTTEINGNCGLSAAPLLGEALERREVDMKELDIEERWSTFEEYFEILQRKGIALNFATLCGQGNIRASVMGYRNGLPTNTEMAEMKRLLSDALQAGTKGLSTGLIYPPGVYSSPEEIAELAGVLSESPAGIYASHMRSEGDRLIEAIEETLKIGRESGAPVHISHIKTSGEHNWHKIDSVVSLIEEAIASGLRVTCDRYPYIASSTDLDTVVPAWVYEGGVEEELRRLKDPAIRSKISSDLAPKDDAYWKSVYVSSAVKAENKWMEGESIFEIAAKVGRHPAEAVLDIIIEEKARAGAIFFSMCEENLRRFLALPYTMIGSDSSVRSFSGTTRSGKPHPRGFGSFPRFIGRYVRDEKLLDLPQAIRRITSMPAGIFGIERRGFIRKGFYADLVIFDYDAIRDDADFRDPFRISQGIVHVFVNGKISFSGGEFTGARAGMVLQ
ncbi:MAG TPA: D-aminoacylase [Dissulfurispiraceae bacterium]|nr:D-aminoacylase [Dissulfurispiraceae bacterium]